MKNRVSFVVVTPSYNQASYIRDTLISVYSQSTDEIFHIVMDGGSTDGTKRILRDKVIWRLGNKNHRYIWKSKRDKGQADAINKGIRMFEKLKKQGDWIFSYLNSDDYYQPHAFAAVEEAFQKNPKAEWIVGDAVIVDEKRKEIQQGIRWYKSIFRNQLFPFFFPILNPIPQPSVFIRWSALKKIGDFNDSLSYVMDYEYWWRLYKTYGPPIFISQALSAFRIQKQSKGSTVFDKQFSEELLVAQKYSSFIQQIFHRIHNSIITGIYRCIK